MQATVVVAASFPEHPPCDSKKRKRVVLQKLCEVACLPCREAKKRCDNGKPCARCLKKGLKCRRGAKNSKTKCRSDDEEEESEGRFSEDEDLVSEKASSLRGTCSRPARPSRSCATKKAPVSPAPAPRCQPTTTQRRTSVQASSIEEIKGAPDFWDRAAGRRQSICAPQPALVPPSITFSAPVTTPTELSSPINLEIRPTKTVAVAPPAHSPSNPNFCPESPLALEPKVPAPTPQPRPKPANNNHSAHCTCACAWLNMGDWESSFGSRSFSIDLDSGKSEMPVPSFNIIPRHDDWAKQVRAKEAIVNWADNCDSPLNADGFW